jgi:hypothetical protein
MSIDRRRLWYTRTVFKLKESEQIVYTAFIEEGWTAYRNGWPDFAFEKDGRVRFVEVKSFGSTHVSEDQAMMHALLERASGIEVEVFLAYNRPQIESMKVTEEDIRRIMRER